MSFYTCFSSHQLWAKQPVDPIGDFESNGNHISGDQKRFAQDRVTWCAERFLFD